MARFLKAKHGSSKDAKGENHKIIMDLDEISHSYEETIAGEVHYMVQMKQGTILPVSKEAYDEIEKKLTE